MLRVRKLTLLLFASALLAASGQPVSAQVIKIKTNVGQGADIELTENTAAGVTTAGGNGTKINFNARWNGAGTTPDRNEWGAVRFDLTELTDKSLLTNASLNFYMSRGNTNNNKNLQFYALNPGTVGEDWAEVGTTYESMPGFMFDTNSVTRDLDATKVTNLGTFTTAGADVEGSLVNIPLAGLTTLVQGMGANNLLTVFITTTGSTNGQWRALAKEAAASETGVATGVEGDFAPFLQITAPGGGGLPGDYDNNLSVGPEDYTLWASSFGSAVSALQNVNPTKAGTVVDASDYTYWRDELPAPSAATASVPEPQSLIVAIGCLFTAAGLAASKRRG